MNFRPTPLLALTSLVCLVEITTLAAALRHGLPAAAIALLLCAFHAGYLLADVLRTRIRPDRLMVILAVSTCAAALALDHLQPRPTSVVAAVTLLAFNSSAQAVRRAFKVSTPVGSIAKNTAKALGMTVGGCLGWIDYGPLLLIAGSVMLAASNVEVPRLLSRPQPKRPQPFTDKLMLLGEFTHHAHYFAYYGTFWYLAPQVLGPEVGTWFVVGWLAYFIAERVWRERRRVFAPGIIAAGHLLVAAALTLMLYLNSAGVMLAWFLTGIGGGTAYMLGNARTVGPRETYEDAGHVAGLLIAALAASLHAPTESGAKADVLVAAALALLTSMIFLAVRLRRQTLPTSERLQTQCE